jgi:predicted alpha/beta-hydrolase family hydrolase
MQSALPLISAPTRLLEVEGAGHDLGRKHTDLATRIVEAFAQL